MRVAPPFLLTRDQALRLQAYIQTYRHYALSSVLPSATRNTILRILQTIQGKVIEAIDHSTTATARISLLFTREEVTVLKTTVTELLSLYAGQPESIERIMTLSDLASLKTSLKKYEE